MKRKMYFCKENDNDKGQTIPTDNTFDLSLMMLGIKI